MNTIFDTDYVVILLLLLIGFIGSGIEIINPYLQFIVLLMRIVVLIIAAMLGIIKIIGYLRTKTDK